MADCFSFLFFCFLKMTPTDLWLSASLRSSVCACVYVDLMLSDWRRRCILCVQHQAECEPRIPPRCRPAWTRSRAKRLRDSDGSRLTGARLLFIPYNRRESFSVHFILFFSLLVRFLSMPVCHSLHLTLSPLPLPRVVFVVVGQIKEGNT